jgi:hypothetical protein
MISREAGTCGCDECSIPLPSFFEHLARTSIILFAASMFALTCDIGYHILTQR